MGLLMGTGTVFLLVHFLVFTVGAALFQPIRAEAVGHPVQSDDGRHLQGAWQIPQQGKTPSHLGLSNRDPEVLAEVFEVVPGNFKAFPGFLLGFIGFSKFLVSLLFLKRISRIFETF